MKAKITRITNGQVFARSENESGEQPDTDFTGRFSTFKKYKANERWKQAESARKELPLSNPTMRTISIGQSITIEETHDGKYFKIV